MAKKSSKTQAAVEATPAVSEAVETNLDVIADPTLKETTATTDDAEKKARRAAQSAASRARRQTQANATRTVNTKPQAMTTIEVNTPDGQKLVEVEAIPDPTRDGEFILVLRVNRGLVNRVISN